MKTSITIALGIAMLFLGSCTNSIQRTKTDVAQTGKGTDTVSYYTLDELFLHAEELSGTTVHVKGIIDHVCKHSGKRFKIIEENETLELKIELGENFPTCDPSIVGKTAKITGKFVPENLSADDVKKWEENIHENHKGEEDTDHFKEEIVQVQKILIQIESGEIPYYVQYHVEAEKYIIE